MRQRSGRGLTRRTLCATTCLNTCRKPAFARYSGLGCFLLYWPKPMSGPKPASPPMPGNIIQVSVWLASGMLPSEIRPDDQIITDYRPATAAPPKPPRDRHQLVTICPNRATGWGILSPSPNQGFGHYQCTEQSSRYKVPTESWYIHTEINVYSMFRDDVIICTDLATTGGSTSGQHSA